VLTPAEAFHPTLRSQPLEHRPDQVQPNPWTFSLKITDAERPLRLFYRLADLLDQPLQADVPPDLVTQVVALEQEKQPGHPSVTVSKWMNAQEVEIERGREDQGMNLSVA
jgi:hypothetical protein